VLEYDRIGNEVGLSDQREATATAGLAPFHDVFGAVDGISLVTNEKTSC
jgi:hypothetical protein